MKKWIPLLLALAMLLSLCACGGGSDTPKADDTAPAAMEEPVVELKLGDTVESDIITFSLDRFEFAKQLYYASYTSMTGPSPDYMLPTDETIDYNPYEAAAGKTLGSYSYSLKYNGKENFDISIVLGIKLEYDDGYTFEPSSVVYLFGDNYIVSKANGDSNFYEADMTLKPLDTAGEGRGYFEVAKEVETSSEKSLEVYVSIPNSDGTAVKAVYVIR